MPSTGNLSHRKKETLKTIEGMGFYKKRVHAEIFNL